MKKPHFCSGAFFIMELIKLQNISKTYRSGQVEVHALKGISLEIEQNNFVAITGHSGSGKSTLLNILGCLDTPTGGNYFLEKEDVSHYSGERLANLRNKKIGFIFQSFQLLSNYTVLENVMLPLLYSEDSSKDAENTALSALQQVGLEEKAGFRPPQLSGGQQQRVAIARALVNEPSIILADEPTGNLDSKTSYQVMDVIKKLHTEGNTVILITHEDDIATYAERIIRMEDGKIISETK